MYACMNLVWGDMCGNEVIEEIKSPDKTLKAIIFIRDCGATTGYSTQLSILELEDRLGNETGNTLILSDKFGEGLSFDNGGAKVKAVWTSENSLTIYFDNKIEFTKKEEEIKDIEISYEQIVE